MSNTITFHMFKTKTTGVGEKEERQGESRGRGQEGESERRDLDLLVFGWDEREFRRKYVWNSMLWKWSHCYQHISPWSLEIWNVSRHCAFRAQCFFFFFSEFRHILPSHGQLIVLNAIYLTYYNTIYLKARKRKKTHHFNLTVIEE